MRGAEKKGCGLRCTRRSKEKAKAQEVDTFYACKSAVEAATDKIQNGIEITQEGIATMRQAVVDAMCKVAGWNWVLYDRG